MRSSGQKLPLKGLFSLCPPLGTTLAVMSLNENRNRHIVIQEKAMTAAAIPNIFPGSPPVGGEKVALSAVPAEPSGFEKYLTSAETAASSQMDTLDEAGSAPQPLQDLFNLLNLLWGNATDDIQEDAPIHTNMDTENNALDTKDQTSGYQLSGFLPELKLILSMFEKIAASLDSVEAALSDTPGPVLPNEAPGLQSTGNEANTNKQDMARAAATLPAAPKVVAPGIDTPIIGAKETKPDMASDLKATNDMPTHSYPGNTRYQIETKPPKATLAQNVDDFDTKMSSDMPKTMNNNSRADSPSRPSQQAENANGHNSHLDLHLLTFSYSRSGGMDVTDLTYSGDLGDESDIQKILAGDSTQIEASMVNFSDGDRSNHSGIQMARASINKKDGTDISLKKMHISSAFFNNQKDVATGATQNSQATAMKNDHGDILSIDFNSQKNADSKGQNDDTLLGRGKGQDANIQDGSVLGNNLNTPQSKGDTPTQARLDDLVTAQIRDGISQTLKMNKNRAILHLNPPELGSVKVSITVSHNNHVQASFVADHPETRHILEANMQHLKESLAQNGFSTAQVNVDVGGGFANGYGAQHEKLTPFGLPSMWLKNSPQETTEEPKTGQSYKTGPYGMHVIA